MEHGFDGHFDGPVRTFDDPILVMGLGSNRDHLVVEVFLKHGN